MRERPLEIEVKGLLDCFCGGRPQMYQNPVGTRFFMPICTKCNNPIPRQTYASKQYAKTKWNEQLRFCDNQRRLDSEASHGD